MADLNALDVARRSPEVVQAQDQAAWIALFAPDAEVHDPVGAPGHPVHGLPAFWATFIAGNDIRFEVHQDLEVDGWAIRDVTIHTGFPGGAKLQVPAHLRYEVVDGRIRRLYAHWELAAMILQVTLAGPLAWFASTRTFLRMAVHMGLGGTVRYLGGLRGAGERGKAQLRRWAGEHGLHLSKVLAAGDHLTATIVGGGVLHAQLDDGAMGEVRRYP